MKKKEKLCVMEKLCVRLRVDYVRFAKVRKSFRYEQNFLFGRNKPAEGRLFLRKKNHNVSHEFLCRKLNSVPCCEILSPLDFE